MLRRALTITPLVLITIAALSQDIAELERRNGFKHIKLGMHIDSLDAEVKVRKEILEQDLYPAKILSVTAPDLQRIGEVNVNKIEIRTYNDRVYQIQVLTQKDPRLMKALESIYGKSVYDMKNQTWFWRGETLILKFTAYGRNQLELLFSSYLILDEMKADREKKVDDIADDF